MFILYIPSKLKNTFSKLYFTQQFLYDTEQVQAVILTIGIFLALAALVEFSSPQLVKTEMCTLSFFIPLLQHLFDILLIRIVCWLYLKICPMYIEAALKKMYKKYIFSFLFYQVKQICFQI